MLHLQPCRLGLPNQGSRPEDDDPSTYTICFQASDMSLRRLPFEGNLHSLWWTPISALSSTEIGMNWLIWYLLWAAAGADASNDKSDKSVEVMRKFSEQYSRRSNTFFCADKTVTAVVIKVSAVR